MYYARKVIFCRPRGGLNDMLCQIHKCRAYAIKSRRDLWIDTSRPGFQDCLSHYFEASQEFFFGSPIDVVCDQSSCFPQFLAGRINSYESVFDRRCLNFVEKETRKRLTFNFSFPYSETVLLHEQCGGGFWAIKAFECLTLKPGIKHTIREVIKGLGEYDAIHVRNTDYTTNYGRCFERLKGKIKDRVVVCTDDFHCQRYAKTFWGGNLAVVHQLPDIGGRPLHQYEFSSADRYRVNLKTLTDLFVLASARNLYRCRTNQWMLSGFGILAKQLHSNPRVMQKLLH